MKPNPFNTDTTKREYEFRADVMRRSIQGECHAIGYGDIKTRPDYCKKLQESKEEREMCSCCSQCCGCGG